MRSSPPWRGQATLARAKDRAEGSIFSRFLTNELERESNCAPIVAADRRTEFLFQNDFFSALSL